MEIKEIKANIKQIVQNLVNKNYKVIYESDYIKYMAVDLMEEAITEYGGTFTMPPESYFDKFIIYTISEDEVSINFDLWCNNEKSDLTLICRFKNFENKIRYSIENIEIL